MKKYIFLVGLLLCPFLNAHGQVTPDLLDALSAAVRSRQPAADTSKGVTLTDSARVADSIRIEQIVQMQTLKEIAIKAPRPIYSMDGEVVSYNVADDETAKGLTALEALQNAPSVEVDIEGNIKLRGTDNVEIWLNGYPTHIDGSALKAYLSSIPADNIDRIEVIMNPSAKHMVSDGCHIINIVTSTKLRNSRFVAVGLGGSSEPALRPWVSYVMQNDKLTANAYIGCSYYEKHTVSSSSSAMRRDNLAGTYDTTSIISDREDYSRQRSIWNCFLNLDYNADSANSIGLFHFSMLNPSHSYTETITRRTDFWPDARSYTYAEQNLYNGTVGNANTNLMWKHKFNQHGRNISFNINHFCFYTGQNSDLSRQYTPLEGLLPEAWQDYAKRNQSRNMTHSILLSGRYNHPVGLNDELSFRLSVNRHWNHLVQTPLFLDPITDRYTVADTLRGRQRTERGWNSAAGASWRHQWDAVTLDMGLNGSVHNSAYSIVSLFPDDSAYSYLELEPTLKLSYRTPGMHYFRFNYALSTSHPGADNLSTSRIYNEDGYSTGNPRLAPSRTHDFGLSWNKFFKSHGSLDINSYARYSSNDISACTEVTDGIDPYLGRVVTYSMPYNMGSSYKIGIESNATYRPTAWLNIRLYANLYRSGYQIDHPKTGLVQNDMTSWNVRLNCWTKIAHVLRFNVSGSYGSPTLSLFGIKKNSASVNLGVSGDFWANRISASVSVSDLFNWNRTDSWNTNPYYMSFSSEHSDSRYITASVTIRLGKMDLEYQARTGSAQ